MLQGLEVTVHERPITVSGWQGSGYAVLSTEYGVGAYKISGGASGGETDISENSAYGLSGMAGAPYQSGFSIDIWGILSFFNDFASIFMDCVSSMSAKEALIVGLISALVVAIVAIAVFKLFYPYIIQSLATANRTTSVITIFTGPAVLDWISPC